MFGLFANITAIYLLYLIYGAAFLFLGVSITAKDMKGSELRLADSLWLLAMFGFLHGAHEWMELGPLIEGRNLSFQQVVAAETVATLLDLISFIFLLQFGLSLLFGPDQKRARLTRIIPALLLLVWGLYLGYYGFFNVGFLIDMRFLRQADIGARYIFGFTGALTTAYGLIAYSGELRVLSLTVSKNMAYAGITFAFYAVFTGLFISNQSMPLLPVPIEVLRGISAFLITYFIAKALNIFDVETRKKIEQQAKLLVQAEKLASLGQLAAGIAHEINNPLANASLGIQTLKGNLRANIAADDVAEKLDAVERNIDRASVIAQELLTFSRQRESELVPLNINTVIRGALTLMRYKLSAVTVKQDLEPIPDFLGDPGKLEQVFINILSNSIEAMPNGGTISLTTFRKGGVIVVQLSDTGVGVDAKYLSRVFDPFFTTKEIGEGTGLGLSICYGIIRQHNGTIEMSSNVGKGTTLTIKLPVRERYEKDSNR